MDTTVDVVVETPRGCKNKYDVDGNGRIKFDRRLPMALVFPADYGHIPGLTGSDAEPLDALVLMIEPTYPGVTVRARPIGVFWIMTSHGREAKIVCVPDNEPAYNQVLDIADLPPQQLDELTHFFETYRDLDAAEHQVHSDGRDGAAVARKVIKEAL